MRERTRRPVLFAFSMITMLALIIGCAPSQPGPSVPLTPSAPVTTPAPELGAPPPPPAPPTAPSTTSPATPPVPFVSKTSPSHPPANPIIIMASTTSTGDSGLMDALIPVFETATGYVIKPIYVGSGAAMTMGERGDADILLVHAPESEVAFMKAGHGIDRRIVMHNDFVIIGPAGDPAGIKGMQSAIDALKKIASARARFISRGDNSGTDQLEKKLWRTAAVESKGQSWYLETGQGMSPTLTIASEKAAYTITDRATFLTRQKDLGLSIMVEGDAAMLNVYHVILVLPGKTPRINAAGARAFSDFMISADAQDIIKTFGIDKYGQPLFFPDHGKTEAELGSV